jgi:predicted secreted hydrolase
VDRRRFLLTPLLLPSLAAAGTATVPAYATPRRGQALHFPRDHGAHPEFRTEWWYVTGVLDAPRAEVGFQLTFFRTRSGRAEQLESPLAARQILFAHAAVSRAGDRLRHAERAARAGLGAGYSGSDCEVHVGAWQMRREGEGADERIRLRAEDSALGLDLTLTPTQPLLLQGEGGWSQKGVRPELASYYVSWPQLRVEGRWRVDERSHEARGRAWFDHEWSSEVLDRGSVGWDWIGINLDDGGALMAFRIRDAAGATVYAHACLRGASGESRRFDAAEISFSPLGHWQSPRNGARYPVRLELRFGQYTVRTRPKLDDQEIVSRRPLPISYWEGLVELEGSLRGRGYLEMTGYAQAMAL